MAICLHVSYIQATFKLHSSYIIEKLTLTQTLRFPIGNPDIVRLSH